MPSGVLCPLPRHWMPVSSVDSGLYPAYFASRSHFCGLFSYNLHFFCDFMFQLSKDEFENWKSQFAISIPNENMSSQSVTTSDESSRSQFVMLNADAGDLKSQVSSHFPDCQSGHIVHCPGCHPVVLRPLARHWMPVSSIDSGLYSASSCIFASFLRQSDPSGVNSAIKFAYVRFF